VQTANRLGRSSKTFCAGAAGESGSPAASNRSVLGMKAKGRRWVQFFHLGAATSNPQMDGPPAARYRRSARPASVRIRLVAEAIRRQWGNPKLPRGVQDLEQQRGVGRSAEIGGFWEDCASATKRQRGIFVSRTRWQRGKRCFAEAGTRKFANPDRKKMGPGLCKRNRQKTCSKTRVNALVEGAALASGDHVAPTKNDKGRVLKKHPPSFR